VYAGASDEIDEQCLNVVIAMMGHADAFSTDVLSQLLEVSVAEFAGSHLDAHLVEQGVGLRVEMNAMEWDILLLAHLRCKRLVAVAFCTSKVEIAMHRLYTVTQ
jgi:hypothetical protein